MLAVLLCWKAAVVFGYAKRALCWDFLSSGAFFWRSLCILGGLLKKLQPNKYFMNDDEKLNHGEVMIDDHLKRFDGDSIPFY